MPQGFVDDLEGEICDEELCECALFHVGENILLPDRIFVRWRIADFALDNAVLKHSRRLALTDVEYFIKQLQGGDLAFHC